MNYIKCRCAHGQCKPKKAKKNRKGEGSGKRRWSDSEMNWDKEGRKGERIKFTGKAIVESLNNTA